MVQHSLTAMLELAYQGVFTPEKIVEKMSHHPASLFGIDRRGYIRPGYYADLVLVDPHTAWTVLPENCIIAGGRPWKGKYFIMPFKRLLSTGFWLTATDKSLIQHGEWLSDSTEIRVVKKGLGNKQVPKHVL